MVEGLKTTEEALPGGFVLTNTIASLLVQAGFIFLILFFELLRRPIRVRAIPDFFTYVEIVAAIAATVSLPWALLGLWRFIRHGTPERSIRQIGIAVLESLQYEGSIDGLWVGSNYDYRPRTQECFTVSSFPSSRFLACEDWIYELRPIDIGVASVERYRTRSEHFGQKSTIEDTQTRRSAHMTDVVRCVHLNQETVRIIKFEGFLRITTVEFQIELT